MAQAKIGDIYELRIDEEQFYIGSTNDFEQRRTQHIFDSKTKNSKVYKAIRANNGVFEMNLLFQIEYYNEVELRIAEREAYDELNPTLNTNRPYISDEEKKDAIAEKAKDYYNNNKAIIAEKAKDYYNNNKAIIAEKAKDYYNNNRFICGCGSNLINKNSVIQKHNNSYLHKIWEANNI